MGLLPISNLATRAPGGGIDMSHPYVWDLVNGAANVWLPRELESAGGWEPVTASVGIEDEAADHADDHTHPGCRTMPEDVRTLIEQGR